MILGQFFRIGESDLNNLFSEYERTVVIGESNIHELFSRYNSILFIINKLKVISTPSVVLNCFPLELRLTNMTHSIAAT